MESSQRLKVADDSPRKYIIISAINFFYLKQFLFREQCIAGRHLCAQIKWMHISSNLSHFRSYYLNLFSSEWKGVFNKNQRLEELITFKSSILWLMTHKVSQSKFQDKLFKKLNFIIRQTMVSFPALALAGFLALNKLLNHSEGQLIYLQNSYNMYLLGLF